MPFAPIPVPSMPALRALPADMGSPPPVLKLPGGTEVLPSIIGWARPVGVAFGDIRAAASGLIAPGPRRAIGKAP